MKKLQEADEEDHPENPISVGVEKLHLFHVDKDISALENRLALLKEQKRMEELRISNNKSRLRAAVEKKKDIDSILQHKVRDRTYDNKRLEEQAELNRQKKQQHREMMEDLTMASYLVKAEEAQQIKQMTIEHEEAVRDIKSKIHESKRLRHEDLRNSLESGRQEYIRYWNGRVKETLITNEKTAQQLLTQRQQKQRYLKELEKEEIKLLKDIYRKHEQAVDTKKDYLTALSVPASEVVELYGKPKPAPKEPQPPLKLDEKVVEYHARLKLPKTVLHEDKLRKVVQNLRQIRTHGHSLSPH